MSWTPASRLRWGSEVPDNWIKALGMGAGGRPLRDDWENERDGLLRRALTFSRKPGIADGPLC